MRKRLLLLLAILLVAPGVLTADDPNALAQKAMKAYQDKHYAASADAFAAAIDAGLDGPVIFYNAACASALAGRPDPAFDFLRRAVDAGYLDLDSMQRDRDLESLHPLPRWTDLLAYAGKTKAMQSRMWDSPAMKTPFAETLPLDARIAGLSRIWSEAKYNFVNFADVPELDWDARYLSYLPKVREAESTFDYYRVLMSFIAALKDGHTNVVPPKELFARTWSEPGVTISDVEGRLIVTRVDDSSAGSIAPGMELVAVDGTPVSEYLATEITPYISASTAQDLRMRTARRVLWGPAGTDVVLGLVDSRGRRVDARVRRMSEADLATITPPQPPFEYRVLAGNIAYVALNQFGDDKAAEEFEAHFAEIARADALIIDVRRNGGGNSGVGYRVLSALVDRPFLTSNWWTREYRPAHRAWGRPEGRYVEKANEVPPSGKRLYTRPVVLLTSSSTYSAAEDFVVAFDGTKRGTIIGEPTGGSTGQPLNVPLPGGGRVRICTKHDTHPDGREFIGVGVQPQIAVHPTLRDLRAGKDTVLDAALAFLRKERH